MNGLHRKYAGYWMVVLLIGLVALSGCPKKAEVTMIPEAQQEKTSAAESVAPPEEKKEAAKSADEEVKARAVIAQAKGLQSVYFEFDQSSIRDEAKAVMKANAEWLKVHAQSKIKIEGNTDERGTREYNQALGQRRATNAKKYLADMGISASRISLVSYGKEKPGCTESAEGCWQKNRKDDFVVVSE